MNYEKIVLWGIVFVFMLVGLGYAIKTPKSRQAIPLIIGFMVASVLMTVREFTEKIYVVGPMDLLFLLSLLFITVPLIGVYVWLAKNKKL